MKKIFLLSALAALIFTASCSSDETRQMVYSVGTTNWYSTNLYDDMAKVESIIAGLGLPTTSYVTFTGKGKNQSAATEDADAQAKTAANEWIGLLNNADFGELHESTRFAWRVSRFSNPTDPDSETIIIAEFKYNMD